MKDESQMNPKRDFAVAKKNEMNSKRKINVVKKDIHANPFFFSVEKDIHLLEI